MHGKILNRFHVPDEGVCEKLVEFVREYPESLVDGTVVGRGYEGYWMAAKILAVRMSNSRVIALEIALTHYNDGCQHNDRIKLDSSDCSWITFRNDEYAELFQSRLDEADRPAEAEPNEETLTGIAFG